MSKLSLDTLYLIARRLSFGRKSGKRIAMQEYQHDEIKDDFIDSTGCIILQSLIQSIIKEYQYIIIRNNNWQVPSPLRGDRKNFFSPCHVPTYAVLSSR